MYRIKFVGHDIYNNLRPWHIGTVFEIQGSEKNVKTPPTPKFGEILPRLCRPGETLDSQLGQIF